MPKATFVKDFDYRTPRKAAIAYKAGYTGRISKLAFETATAAGVLEVSNDDEQIHEQS